MDRITSSFLSNQSINFLNTNLNILSEFQTKLSTGQNINKPSDDPIGATRILDLSNTLRTDQRYKRNIENAIVEVNTADKVLGNMVDLVHRVQELTTQAATVTNNQAGRNAIALEVDQIIDQLVQLGNTDIGGKYIFGGFQTGAPPFVRSDDYIIDYNGTPAANPWQRPVEVARGITMDVNINGENFLGTAAGPAGNGPVPLPAGIGGSGLFQTMTELLADLRSPTPAPPATPTVQLEEIRLRLDELTAGLNTLSANQSIVGSISNRLELTNSRIEERKSVLTQQYADIQDIDMAETIANLTHHENVFQASLAVTGRVLQTSLLDFLR